MFDDTLWLEDDVDESSGTALLNDRSVAAATALTRNAPRRAELRAEIERSSVRISPRDAAIATGIGALGAVSVDALNGVLNEHGGDLKVLDPLKNSSGQLDARDVHQKLQSLFETGEGGLNLARLSQMGAGREEAPLFKSFVDRLRDNEVEFAEAGQRAHKAWLDPGTEFVEAFLVDGEDVFESGLVRAATDFWAKRQGWRRGDQAFHEFKALAYGTTGVISLATANANPVALGLGGWHLVQAMRSSFRTTDLIVELTDCAIADAADVMSDWEAMVRERPIDVMVATTIAQPMPDKFGGDLERRHLRAQFGGE